MSDAWRCDYCGGPLAVGDFPFCKGDPAEHVRRRQHIFGRCDVEIDGQVHTLSSIQDADRLEKEAGRRAANGEGAPLAFRAFHQDSSNQDRNCFGKSPQQELAKRFEVRRGGEAELHRAVRRIYGRD